MRLAGWFDMTSLRARLVLVPTAILFLGLAGTLLFIVAGARGRVQAEVDSGIRLGTMVVQDTLRAAAAAPDPAAAYARLWAQVPQVRHVRFLPGATAAVPAEHAPRWFARLLAPRPQTFTFPVALAGVTAPPILMRTHPADEVEEIRSEVLLLGAVLLGIWVALTGLIWLTVGILVRPLSALADAFDRLEHAGGPNGGPTGGPAGPEHGDCVAVPPSGVAELRRIGARFNRLAAALDQARRDNCLLIDRLMSLQDAERRELAHELHDEIGPSLFGIRADAACIQRWCRGTLPPPTTSAATLGRIGERAAAIDGLADGVQRLTYRMLDRLRPLLLNELGLADAVLALVDGWRARLPDIEWTVTIGPLPGGIDEDAALTLYRFVQEGLTNAARHASARHVRLRLGRAANGDLHAALGDDGTGLPAGFRYGFGLLGMNERARRLRGRLTVRRQDSGGTSLEITLPPAVVPADARIAA